MLIRRIIPSKKIYCATAAEILADFCCIYGCVQPHSTELIRNVLIRAEFQNPRRKNLRGFRAELSDMTLIRAEWGLSCVFGA